MGATLFSGHFISGIKFSDRKLDWKIRLLINYLNLNNTLNEQQLLVILGYNREIKINCEKSKRQIQRQCHRMKTRPKLLSLF